jgi:transcriptional regulator with XRE-family HTH domain
VLNTLRRLPLKRRVRVYLAAEGITQTELAAQVGIRANRLSVILSGRATPSAREVLELERITGIPARDFIEIEAHV